MTNENIPSLDTVARALAASGDSLFQLSVALAKAQARIVELEAQAAVLAQAIQQSRDAACVCPLHLEPGGHLEGCEQLAADRMFDSLLANLPQAVRQHLARDRAAEAILVDPWLLAVSGQSYCIACRAMYSDKETHRPGCKWDAYRAAGGEVGK